MRKTKSFSVDDAKDKDILKHLDKMSNASAYIANLIRNDMNKKSTFTDEQKNEIFNLIQQYVNENDIIINKTNNGIDSDIVNALDQFD